LCGEDQAFHHPEQLHGSFELNSLGWGTKAIENSCLYSIAFIVLSQILQQQSINTMLAAL
jgi:hypothetical protein